MVNVQQEENFGTSAGVHLIEGIHLIWDLPNTGIIVHVCS